MRLRLAGSSVSGRGLALVMLISSVWMLSGCVCFAACCWVVFCGIGSLLVECSQTWFPLCRASIYSCCALSHLLLTSLVAAPSQLALSGLVCAPLSQLTMFTLAHISVVQACAIFLHHLLPFVATGSSSRRGGVSLFPLRRAQL